MALVCDYCGDVTESSERISVAFGHNQEIALKGSTATKWFYYCEGECADTVRAMLDNLGLYALHGEGSGLVWELVEQKRAPTIEEVKPKTITPPTPDPAPSPKDDPFDGRGSKYLSWFICEMIETKESPEEIQERIAKGTQIHRAKVFSKKTLSLLREVGIFTLEDAAALTETEFLGLPGIGPKVSKQMIEALDELGLAFEPGPSTRQLGTCVRAAREDASMKLSELAAKLAAKMKIPEEDKSGYMARARRQLEQLLLSHERGAKALAPPLIDLVTEELGLDRDTLLAEAAKV